MKSVNKEFAGYNWIHLDLKGTIPPLPSLMEQLTCIRGYGYNGVIFEYEDRLDWKSWKGLRRSGFSESEHRCLLSHCRKLGLEVIPLIQTLGHFEWVLKHPEFARFRENGSLSELCPSVPEVGEKLREWIKEVLSIHPGCRFLHIGGDEPFHLATCPQCRNRAEKSPLGKYSVYLDHMGEVCRFILKQGIRPIIWADPFTRSGCIELLSELPLPVILAEWRYNGTPDTVALRKTLKTGHEFFGCSGICTGYYEHGFRIEERLDDRFRNIDRWRKISSRLGLGRINTVWGRGSGLWEIYSPWHGHWPAIIHAGDPGCWKCHPWNPFFRKLDRILSRDRPDELKAVLPELSELPAANRPERECLEYWSLALSYQRLVSLIRMEHSQFSMLRYMKPYAGEDPWVVRQIQERMKSLESESYEWKSSAEDFFRQTGLSESEEFIFGRTAYLLSFLERNPTISSS